MKRRGDEFGLPADAFSNAILAEKDPAIRGYAENLRSQVAEIARKYGATAGTAWDADVMERMDVDDLSRAAELVKMIGEMSRGKLPAVARREIGAELGRRYARAMAILDRVEADGFGRFSQMAPRVVQMYLDAGMAEKAYELIQTQEDDTSRHLGHLRVKVMVARARELSKSDMTAARQFLYHTLEAARPRHGLHEASARPYLEAFDLLLTLSTDEEVEAQARVIATNEPVRIRSLALERLTIEFERRGLDKNSKDFVALQEIDKADRMDGLQTIFSDGSKMNPSDAMVVDLCTAEWRAAYGFRPEPWIQRAFESAVSDRWNWDEYGPRVAWSAGKSGAHEIVEKVSNRWRMPEGNSNLDYPRIAAAFGCVAAGRLDEAVQYIRAGAALGQHVRRDGEIGVLIKALIDADMIDLAAKVHAEHYGSRPYPFNKFMGGLPFTAARARRGEDMLAEEIGPAVQVGGRKLQPTEDQINAATATIQYVEAARKRMESYGTAR